MSKYNLNDYIGKIAKYHTIVNAGMPYYTRKILRTRARSTEISKALEMKIYDPLWMLARQWQLGEFQGNDAATAMSVMCRVRQHPISACGQECDEPFEYAVEKVTPEVTPYMRVEAAMHYFKLLQKALPKDRLKAKMTALRQTYPLDVQYVRCGVDNESIKNFAYGSNTSLAKFSNAFSGIAFDGVALYNDILSRGSSDGTDKEYCRWFEKRYALGQKQQGDSPVAARWDNQQMSYEASMQTAQGTLDSKDYSGGRLTWYSFDVDVDVDEAKVKTAAPAISETTEVYALPTLATYPGAPAKRLWQFEDHKVYLGNSSEKEQAQGNIILMQYASMYSNDWMLIPLQTRLGRYIEIEELRVWDTFGGEPQIIRGRDNALYSDKTWGMFNISPSAPSNPKALQGLLMPPVFADTLESKPVEEVQFLRDEMANMVWGVETVIPDGTGSTLDGQEYSQAIADYIGEYNEEHYARKLSDLANGRLTVSRKSLRDEVEVDSNRLHDYKYTIQSKVPLNWIPFLPQRLKDKENTNRETILRRGKMPCFVYDPQRPSSDHLLPVRPVSSLIRTEFVTANGSSGTQTLKEKPFYINEEEVLQTGIKVVKNYQRARWFDGKVFYWMGISRQLSKMDANSGLVFDKLSNAWQ